MSTSLWPRVKQVQDCGCVECAVSACQVETPVAGGICVRTAPLPSSLLPRVFRSLLYAFTVRARAASIKIVRFATGRGLSSHIAHGSARGRYVRRTRRIRSDRTYGNAAQRADDSGIYELARPARRAERSPTRDADGGGGGRGGPVPRPRLRGRIYSITLS